MGMGNVNNANGRDNRDLNAVDDALSGGGEDSIESRLIAMNSSGSRPQLTFHSVCGENVRIQKQGRVAKRVESFCKGLAFSARPIEVNEIVVMKLAETATNWSGVLRFGVSNTNPQTMQNSLPKYACPDLTNKEGNWAKALTERYCQQGNLIHFFVLANGELHYGINGVQKGLYLSGINCTVPMWVLLDIYGNSNCVEFIDPSEVPSLRTAANRSAGLSSSSNGNSASAATTVSSRPEATRPSVAVATGGGGGTLNRPASTIAAPLNNHHQHHQQQPITSFAGQPTTSRRASENAQALATAQVALELNQRLVANNAANAAAANATAAAESASHGTRPQVSAVAGASWEPLSNSQHHQQHQPASFAPRNVSSSYPPLKFNCGFEITPFEFHQIHGKNITLGSDNCLAVRRICEYSLGYVFTKRPIRLNEKIIVQILKILPQYTGSLTFGITTCDPIKINPESMPEDADNFMDRGEYWVINKDVAGASLSELDELSFYINQKGEVHFQRNNTNPRIILYADHSQALYFFFDVFGTTHQIRLVGSVEVTPFRPPAPVAPLPGNNSERTRQQQNALPVVNRVAPVVSQSSAPASPGVRQPSYGQLHVQLPPPAPTLPRNQTRAVSANSLPSLSSSVSVNQQTAVPGQYNGGVGHRGRGSGPHHQQQQPPARPPPPNWHPQTAAVAAIAPVNNLATADSAASGIASGVANVNLFDGPRTASSSMDTNETNDECAICMQSKIDCALYTCGHMCMCYTCAVETWQRHGFCPVCRQPIKDVIKIFKST